MPILSQKLPNFFSSLKDPYCSSKEGNMYVTPFFYITLLKIDFSIFKAVDGLIISNFKGFPYHTTLCVDYVLSESDTRVS